jgi:membrane-associated phospholipid phosphatase
LQKYYGMTGSGQKQVKRAALPGLLLILLHLGLVMNTLPLKAQMPEKDTCIISQSFFIPDSSFQGHRNIKEKYLTPSPVLRFSKPQLTMPAILMGAGIAMDLSSGFKNTQLSFHDKHLSGFHTAADNALLYVPAVIPYGLDLLGVSSKTDIKNRTAILIKAEILVTASGYLLKHTVHQWRPDRSNRYSFPSGHSMQVFATATMLSMEYKDQFKWMPYAAYGLATGVGMLRLANNKHYVGDVLVGAALGILSMKLAYWTHHYKWHKHPTFK